MAMKSAAGLGGSDIKGYDVQAAPIKKLKGKENVVLIPEDTTFVDDILGTKADEQPPHLYA